MSIGDRLNDHGYKLLCLVTLDPYTSDLVGMWEGIAFVAIGLAPDAAGVVRVDADFALAPEMAVNHLP